MTLKPASGVTAMRLAAVPNPVCPCWEWPLWSAGYGAGRRNRQVAASQGGSDESPQGGNAQRFHSRQRGGEASRPEPVALEEQQRQEKKRAKQEKKAQAESAKDAPEPTMPKQPPCAEGAQQNKVNLRSRRRHPFSVLFVTTPQDAPHHPALPCGMIAAFGFHQKAGAMTREPHDGQAMPSPARPVIPRNGGRCR